MFMVMGMVLGMLPKGNIKKDQDPQEIWKELHSVFYSQ